MIIGKICVGLTNVQHFTVFPLTEGLVGAEIEIEYTHPVWKQLRKLVTFRAGKVIKSTWDERGVVEIPWEVLEKAGKTLHVGITGTSVSNEIIVPTIQFSFDQPIQPSMEPGAESGADPTLPIWAQLDARLKNLEEHDDEIDEERLEEVVNDALKKAKENGDFTGPPGPIGPHGPQGMPGENGKSGVYVLSDGETTNDVPNDINVVIDPNGDENYATDVGAPIYSMDSNNPTLSGVATTQKVPLHIYGFVRKDGTISTVENAMRTDYVAITSRMSSIYAKVNMSSGGYALAFFDGDKNLLPDISVLGTAELPQIVNVSLNESYDNAKFFVVGYYDANKEYIHYDCTINYSANASGTNDYGLNILVFGDSISTSANISVDEYDCTTQYTLKTNSYQNASGQSIVFNTWPNLLPNVLGCKDIRNYAYSGASYKDQERANGLEFQNLSYQVQVALNDVSNPNNVFPSVNYSPDIVIFALGTNDGPPNDTPESALSKIVLSEDGYSIDVDSTLASLNKGNFCESAMWAFLTVKKAFPMALGFCVLPIQRASSEANTQELHGYLSKMARRYGFIVIDGTYETGIVRDLEVCDGLGTMLKDGLHPNEKGQNLLCRAILTAIRRYYLPFAGMN